MTDAEIIQTVARLRRDMPRNETAMALCAAVEELMAKDYRSTRSDAPKLSRAEIQKNYRLRKKASK